MKKFIPLLLTLTLLACNKGSLPYTPQAISFAGQPPIKIKATEIRVIDGYQSPFIVPNVEHEFPTPPQKAVHDWVNTRMKAAGSDGILEVTIEDASVKEIPLPKKGGIEGWFTDQQDARFDANLKVTFRLYADANGLADASANVSVVQSQTINEKTSVADRERVYDAMTRTMMDGFEKEAQAQLGQYFQNYLVR